MAEPARLTVLEGSMSLLGSPGEFARLERDGHAPPTAATVTLGPPTEPRMFTLPQGTAALKAKVPGHNIRVVRPGAVLTSKEAPSDD